MLNVFQTYLKANYLLQPQYQFIVACSGGIDSVVLCELCFQSGLHFSIAHCNFGLRGWESDRDEGFVKSLGEKYKVPVHVKHFDTQGYGLLKKVSIQEAARELRYQWFEALHTETGADYVFLAHHANDNIETVLMHFFRGTGLHGLTGMPEHAEGTKCLRPMLHHKRSAIEAFANSNKLQWVEDASNQSDKYTRNFFRNQIIPAIQEKYPQAEENVLATIERLKKTETLYAELVSGALKKIIVEKGSEIWIPISKLKQYSHTALPYEVFKKFLFHEKQLPEIFKLAGGDNGSYIQNSLYRIVKHRNWFVITPLALPQTDLIPIEEGLKKVRLDNQELQISTLEKQPFQLNRYAAVAQLDSGAISFPLLARRWKEGDYFYPLGMRKKKKLARFFIDMKLSLPEKEAVWVIESNKRIIWVVGYRIDDRFKLTGTTKRVLQLSVSPAIN